MNQMQQELQNELSTTNQLLRLISMELQKIKCLTSSGGDLENNISQNAALIKKLANLQQIDLEKLPAFTRKQIDMSIDSNQNASHEQHNTFRQDSEMEESR